MAEFYQKVYELEVVDKLSDNNSFCLTDGKVSLVIRPWDMVTYSALLQGLDHIGFKVENLEEVKSEFDEMVKSYPESAPRKIAVGREGASSKGSLPVDPERKRISTSPFVLNPAAQFIFSLW